MAPPLFLSLDEVTELHHESIDRYGGTYEIRDVGLLQSALAMPSASFAGEYLHPDLATMAGALFFHLIQNHPFVDGNKRTGTLAARVFLLMNDANFDPPGPELERMAIGVASGQITKDEAIGFFAKHTRISL